MGFFKQVEGEACVLVSNGVFMQTDIYTMDGFLYAKSGGGFIRLMHDASTTKAKTRLHHMTWSGELCRDSMGRLCMPEARGAQPLEDKRANQLLLGAE